jgi:hypothetical protein
MRRIRALTVSLLPLLEQCPGHQARDALLLQKSLDPFSVAQGSVAL